ncbi:MAG: thiolase family protein [Pseudomonadota bacterium]
MNYDGVVLAAPFSLVPARRSAATTQRLAAEVLAGVLAAAGMDHRDLDGLALASLTIGPDSVVTLCEHLGLSCRYLDQPPMGGASAIASMRRAARMVAAGDVSAVALIGADNTAGANFAALVENFSDFARRAVWPYGAGGPNTVFALITDHYMTRFGARREDFGKLCVAQRDNAQGVPHAVFGARLLSLDDYLSARPIADPLALYDCVMPVAGGEGCLLMREADEVAAGLPFARILATLERHNGFAGDPVQIRGGWALEREEFWARAGVGPADMDVVETYDDYPVMSLIQLEDLGFCGKGEGPAFVRANTLTRDGTLPHNTSGGQLSAGQAGAAGGHLGLVEALRQVTGTAHGWQATGAVHDWQVKDASLALVSGFGMANYDRGVCATAAVLARGRGR